MKKIAFGILSTVFLILIVWNGIITYNFRKVKADLKSLTTEQLKLEDEINNCTKEKEDLTNKNEELEVELEEFRKNQ